MENNGQLDLDLYIAEERKRAKLEKFILKLTPQQYDTLAVVCKKYNDSIDISITELSNDPKKVINYLFNNRDHCLKKRKEAEEKDDLYNEKKHQLLIDQVLDQKIREWWTKIQTNYVKTPREGNTMESLSALNDADSKLKITQSLQNTPPFQQIKCEATEQEILDYFMPLGKILNYMNGKPVMEEKDIIDFVHNNFAMSGKSYTQKYYALNIPSKSSFTFLIYQFYHRYDYNDIKNKTKYAELMIRNFKNFAKDNPKTLCSNMSFSKRPKNSHNVIDIDKFLNSS